MNISDVPSNTPENMEAEYSMADAEEPGRPVPLS
jgi:hypothetical protein